jgi:hypothetical protein
MPPDLAVGIVLQGGSTVTSKRSLRGSTWVVIVLVGLLAAAVVIGEIIDAFGGTTPPIEVAVVVTEVVCIAYIILGLFFLPTIVGIYRRVDGLAVVVLLNIFLAWTLAGWVGALIRALGPTKAQVAAAAPVASLVISPDGRYWWDGRAWQSMPGTMASATTDLPEC